MTRIEVKTNPQSTGDKEELAPAVNGDLGFLGFELKQAETKLGLSKSEDQKRQRWSSRAIYSRRSKELRKGELHGEPGPSFCHGRAEGTGAGATTTLGAKADTH